MSRHCACELRPIGVVRSTLEQRAGAPRQAWLGAPPARLEIDAAYARSLEGVVAGHEIWVLT